MRRLVSALALALLVCTLDLSNASAEAGTAGVEGRVTYENAPVAGARVTAGDMTVRTDATGRFAFTARTVSGTYESVDVIVRAGGYGEWRLLGARLFPGDTLRVTANLEQKAVTVRQPAPATHTNTQTAPTSGTYNGFATASHTTPPATIRVWVTGSTACDKAAKGEVQVVNFKDYVKHVLPSEWLGGWPSESLRAGALATKSYAWFQVNRGGKWPDLGADVMDSTCDQVYNPAVSYASTDQAIEDTWGQRVTRDGKIHISQYWAGTRDDGARPAADSPYAGRLSQWGSEYWARQGKTWDWILNYYYDYIVISSVTGGDLRLV